MFPEKFLFGTSTAAHQVEGDNKWNDWWYYEEMGKLPTNQERPAITGSFTERI